MEEGDQTRTLLQNWKSRQPIKSKPPIRAAVREWASEHRIQGSAVDELLGFLPAVNSVVIRKDLMATTNPSPCKRKESALFDEDEHETSPPKTNKRSKTTSLEDLSGKTPDTDNRMEQHHYSIEQKLERFLTALSSKVEVMDQKLDVLLTRADERHAACQAKLDANAKMICTLRDEFIIFKKAIEPPATESSLPEIPSKLPTLPASSIPALQALEQLLEDEEQQEIFVKALTKIGGARETSIVNSIMRYIMSKEVAMRFSLRGKFGKHSFDKLRIYKCVMETLKQNRKTQALTEHELNLLIGNHLAQANLRRLRPGPNTSPDELGLLSSPQSPLRGGPLDLDHFFQSPSSPLAGAAKTETCSGNESD